MKKPLIFGSFALLIFSSVIDAAPFAIWTVIEGLNVFINEQSIERQQNGNVRVWQKEKLFPSVVTKLETDLRAIGNMVDFSDYEYSIRLWEYDCNRKRFGAVSGADYSSIGEVINSFELEIPLMITAVPESIGYSTLDAVCSNRRAKSKK